MMCWYGNGMDGWGSAVTLFNSLLFWGLIIVGVVALVRYLARDDQAGRMPSAEQLLAERFDRGEIDDEEYHQRLTTLRHGPRTHGEP